MAERTARYLKGIKWSQIVLSALATGGAIAVILDKSHWLYSYLTALLAISILILNAYVKDLNPGELAQRHREIASDIWNAREAYLSLLADLKDTSIANAHIRQRRDDIQRQLHAIYKVAPHTDGTAYAEAQRALKDKEDLTFSEGEIDLLLPKSLRRGPADQ
jgi:hypothetical protein